MKITHLKNGDMVVTQGSKPIYVILGILIFLFFGKDAFLWIFTEENVSGNRALAVSMIFLTVLFFYRVWALSSEFKFKNIEKRIEYSVQYPFFNKKGTLPISKIEKAFIETDSDDESRIVIRCYDEEIPMTAAVKGLGQHCSACEEINAWLKKNS